MSLSLIYTTFPDQSTADAIVQKLLEERLIGCANILNPITSHYLWKGNIEKSQEIAVFLKTSGGKSQKVIDALTTLHPYEVPAILEIPIGQSASSFSLWIQEAVREGLDP